MSGGYTLVADARRVYKKIQQLLGTDMPAEFKFVRRAHTQDSHIYLARTGLEIAQRPVPSLTHEPTSDPVLNLTLFVALRVVQIRSLLEKASQQTFLRKTPV